MRIILMAVSFTILVCGCDFSHRGGTSDIRYIQGSAITCGIDENSGSLCLIESNVGGKTHMFMNGPVTVSVRNEYTNANFLSSAAPKITGSDTVAVRKVFRSKEVGDTLTVTERWSSSESGVSVEFGFEGTGEQAGHEVTLDFPILSPDSYVFTPSERGILSVAVNPSFRPTPYANTSFNESMRHYVLPLVSVFDPGSDTAVTIALPPDSNIPALQMEWMDGKILRIRLGHRGMGQESPSSFKILLYGHEADYRSVIKAYSDDYPEYFQPVIEDGAHDGAFYYHYITNHPPFDEMARQNIRNIWAGHFWSPYFGEFMPEETEWYPLHYTDKTIPALYHQKMGDTRMNEFIHEMLAHGIGTFAYFSMTEYGGDGGQFNNDDFPRKRYENEFRDNVMKDENGNLIRSFKNTVVMNPGRGTPYNEQLRKIAHRYLKRVPDIQGFMVDRTDWASPAYTWNRYGCDFSKYDGSTMVGNRRAMNMAVPVAEAIQDIADITHQAGKRIFINHFWRIELTKNVDGYASEYDYTRGLMYFSPYRPISAWCSVNYSEDEKIQFEAQLKRRLQVALYPHMIAKDFVIIQQRPNPRAAAMLEIFTPLFNTLTGKKQVLIPHCVSVTGSNDVNLFVNGDGYYVVPVTSRVRFLSRGCQTAEPVMVTLRVPDASELAWAHVYSVDAAPYRASISFGNNEAIVTAERHCSSSMIVVGKGAEPPLRNADEGDITRTRESFLSSTIAPDPQVDRPSMNNIQRFVLRMSGDHVGEPGKTSVSLDGNRLGELVFPTSNPSSSGYFSDLARKYRVDDVLFELPRGCVDIPATPPTVEITCGDEATWFAPEYMELLVILNHRQCFRIAEWRPDFTDDRTDAVTKSVEFPLGGYLNMKMKWCESAAVDF